MPFKIVRNDITKMNVDAIVNPANPQPMYGAGIDCAVYRAAGEDELLAARRKIGPIANGRSAVTSGYRLPAKYIIHTVGTAWRGGHDGEEEVIRSCYRTVFECAVQLGAESLALPLLASGSYGFPKGIALKIALSEIQTFLTEHETEVSLVVFDEKAFSLSGELYGDIDSYIDANYVETVQYEEYSSREPDIRGGRRCKARSEMSAPLCMNAKTDVAAEPCVSPEKAKSKRTLEDAIRNLDKTFMELVFTFADQKGITDVELQKRANLDKRTYSKLKCGTTKKPSQTTALALAIGLELNLDETKDLLSRAGLALSPCSRLDLIVEYFIEREIYNIYDINVALFEHGEPLLGSQETKDS